MISNVLSIVCAYNPELEKLQELVKKLLLIGDVAVVRNAGDFVLEPTGTSNTYFVIEPNVNLGTLAAYNRVFRSHSSYQYYWLWNQDTEIGIEEIYRFLTEAQRCFERSPNVACVTVFDKKNFVSPFNPSLVLAKESTTLISRGRVQRVLEGWFDENLFMDYGDWDFSYRLFLAGGRILQIRNLNIMHKLGDQETTLAGTISRPSLLRLYMQGMNSVYMVRKHGFLCFLTALLVLRVFFIPIKNLLFRGAIERTIFFFRGVIAGVRGEMSSTYIFGLRR